MPDLKPFLDVNYKQGKDDGFHYIEDADISAQGRDFNLRWRSIMKVAKPAKIPVKVDFTWQDQPTAGFPGRIGLFVYDGK